MFVNKFKEKYDGLYRVVQVNENGVTYELRKDNIGHVMRAHHVLWRPYNLAPDYISNNPVYQLLVTGLDRGVVECSESDNYNESAYISTDETTETSTVDISSWLDMDSFEGFQPNDTWLE